MALSTTGDVREGGGGEAERHQLKPSERKGQLPALGYRNWKNKNQTTFSLLTKKKRYLKKRREGGRFNLARTPGNREKKKGPGTRESNTTPYTH